MPRSIPTPQAVLIGVTILWGSTFAVTKDLLRDSPPLLYLSVRFVVAALLMGTWQVLQIRRRRPRTAGLGRDALLLGLLQTGGLLLQVLGQAHTTASKSSFLTALSVPLVPLCGLLLRGDRPRREQVLAVIVGAAGLLLLTYPGSGVHWNPGDLLTVACAFVYTVAIVETAHRARRHPALLLAALQTAVCAVLFSLLAWLFPDARPLYLSGSLLLKWLYMGVVCTVVTFSAQTWAMSRMDATQAAVIFALEPVFATVLALLFFGATEWPGARGAIGCGLVLLAVLGSEAKILGTR